MPQLSLQQIETKLNSFFSSEERTLVFWYDEKQEFVDVIQQLQLKDVKVYQLEENGQFKAKLLLEIEDIESSYLIYAPFARPDIDHDHLLGTREYSGEFHADVISLLQVELDLDPQFKPLLVKYRSFFNARNRVERFKEVFSDDKSEQAIKLAILATITKANYARIDSILFVLFSEGEQAAIRYIDDFKKYGILEDFWLLIEKTFGFSAKDATFQQLVYSFYLHYFYYQIGKDELPKTLKHVKSIKKIQSVNSFMDQFINDQRYSQQYDEFADYVFSKYGKEVLNNSVDELIDASTFRQIDGKIIQWFVERLANLDTTSKLAQNNMLEIIKLRLQAHYGSVVKSEYGTLKHAWHLIYLKIDELPLDYGKFIDEYQKESYWMDTHYRKFIENLRNVKEDAIFTKLKMIVEKKYEQYLNYASSVWNEDFSIEKLAERVPLARNFYKRFIGNDVRERIIVFISDAFRYEAAQELKRRIERDVKIEAELDAQAAILPSVTEFGMASLLPHHEISYSDTDEVLLDGKKTYGIINREKILVDYQPDSVAIQYDTIMNMNREELRTLAAGKKVFYIYHDQIDKRGDKGKEHEVFQAVDVAISELEEGIRKLSNHLSIGHFIVTADHGFLYQAKKVEEFSKIENPSIDQADRVERRFILSQNHYRLPGVNVIKLGDSLGNSDERYLHFPSSTSIFKKAGGGQNYVHGGSSIQEMLTPVLEVKVKRGQSKKVPVAVELMSQTRKITGLSTTLEFYQREPISDLYTPVKLKLYFVDSAAIHLSGEQRINAQSKSTNPADRFTKVNFDFISRDYTLDENYYLVVEDIDSGEIINRYNFKIDNPYIF